MDTCCLLAVQMCLAGEQATNKSVFLLCTVVLNSLLQASRRHGVGAHTWVHRRSRQDADASKGLRNRSRQLCGQSLCHTRLWENGPWGALAHARAWQAWLRQDRLGKPRLGKDAWYGAGLRHRRHSWQPTHGVYGAAHRPPHGHKRSTRWQHHLCCEPNDLTESKHGTRRIME